MNPLAVLIVLLLTLQPHAYRNINDNAPAAGPGPYSIDHSPWTDLLEAYVDLEGNVNYKDWKKNEDALIGYLDYLAENSPKSSWTKNQRLAYFINLYNAATVKLILDHYPVKSINEITRPWGKDRVQIGSKRVSLGHIEHQILRKMDEPRIHFAINCASNSCPKLLKKAYEPDILELQLENATRGFISDTKRNEISTGRLVLSKIFKWYKKDFTKYGSLQSYIATYTSIAVSPEAKINYLPYDWTLNETKE